MSLIGLVMTMVVVGVLLWLLNNYVPMSAALHRLIDGEDGVCVECAERMSPARLHAVPEVQTCVSGQNRIEGFAWRM
jgi:hypothetical protein